MTSNAKIIASIGYGNSLPIFQRYLQDPAKWYDLLADHLSSPQFLARWSMTATSPGYTTGHRQLYQWNTQLTLLEKAAAKAGKEIHYKTDVVTQGLTTAALMPNFQKVVWTDELRQTMKAVSARRGQRSWSRPDCLSHSKWPRS